MLAWTNDAMLVGVLLLPLWLSLWSLTLSLILDYFPRLFGASLAVCVLVTCLCSVTCTFACWMLLLTFWGGMQAILVGAAIAVSGIGFLLWQIPCVIRSIVDWRRQKSSS